MKPTTLEAFFRDKVLTIPVYQRDYSWTAGQVEDLLDDVGQAVEFETGHFIGMFTLCGAPNARSYAVVDGQQRVATLTMLAHALRAPGDLAAPGAPWFMRDDGRPRLELAGSNGQFFQDLVAGSPVHPETAGQHRLVAAHEQIRRRVVEVEKEGATTRGRWLDRIANLQVVTVQVEHAGDAVRMFQTINDRGKPLSYMEKTKSLLISYSNRFLDRALDQYVNETFGKMFQEYDRTKATPDVPFLESDWVTEDDVLAAQFSTYGAIQYANEDFKSQHRGQHSYRLRALERGLKERRGKKPELSNFIRSYVDDALAFFQALGRVVARTRENGDYYNLLCLFEMSSTLRPLLVRLEMLGWLDAPVPQNHPHTFRDLLEIVDMRLYKRGSRAGEGDLPYWAQAAVRHPPAWLANELLAVTSRWGDDATFSGDLAYAGRGSLAVRAVFVRHEAKLRGESRLDRAEIIALRDASVDEILAHDVEFSARRGFPAEAYPQWRRCCLGNLTLVEAALKPKLLDKLPEMKASEPDLYPASKLAVVGEIVALIPATGEVWNKGLIDERTARLAAVALESWPLWRQA